MIRSFRSLIIQMLALWKGISKKQIASRFCVSQQKLSRLLKKASLEEGEYRTLLRAVRSRPAEVAVATSCLESLEFINGDSTLTRAERDEVELSVLRSQRLVRKVLTEAALRSREVPALDGYPEASGLEAARWHAHALRGQLRGMSAERRTAAVKEGRYRSWALVELVCEESVVEASRDLDRAADLAGLAVEIAGTVRGPEAWRNRVLGYAQAHVANVLRVRGRLKDADQALAEACRLWDAGSDPLGVLDPGRLLNLKGALRRGQRRFEEALDCLDGAALVGRSRELALIQKGFTLEVMEEYDRAVEALLEAASLVEEKRDTRLRNILRMNLTVNLTHAGRFEEAAKMVRLVREVAVEMGDTLGVLRTTWAQGRIEAGLGRIEQALSLLEQARREFESRDMAYDVALALLEMAALLLEQGRTAEVKLLAAGLVRVFESEEVHQEALGALALFLKAVEQETATAALARRLLRFLFKARYDPGLRFES
jgi:tetratricopeptide (TPR) repeat protein/transposase